MHSTAIVITQEKSVGAGIDDEVIADAMDSAYNIEWDFWTIQSESFPIDDFTLLHLDNVSAAIANGVWYGYTRFIPWKKRCFKSAEFPPLDWIRQQGKFVTLVKYHH